MNVNSLSAIDMDERIQDDSWLQLTTRNKSLRVAVNFLKVECAAQNYSNILKPYMPLETLRMYFSKSFNSNLIQYISDNYSETLSSLFIVDAITEPTLRYHNPMLYDVEPDPLVLMCWKCKHLKELVIIGYEMLELNLIAIAKLRTNLKVFNLPMDCIIDLKYGKFVRYNQFVEDEDGDDMIVEYGFCSEQVIDKVSLLALS